MEQIILEMENLNNAMAQKINEAHRKLPFYLIEKTMGNLYTQVQVAAQSELAQAKAGAAKTAP
jgi:hypothetical protein